MVYDYDEICKIYYDVKEADLGLVKFMIEKTGITKDSNVLEVGCGKLNP